LAAPSAPQHNNRPIKRLIVHPRVLALPPRPGGPRGRPLCSGARS